MFDTLVVAWAGYGDLGLRPTTARLTLLEFGTTDDLLARVAGLATTTYDTYDTRNFECYCYWPTTGYHSKVRY